MQLLLRKFDEQNMKLDEIQSNSNLKYDKINAKFDEQSVKFDEIKNEIKKRNDNFDKQCDEVTKRLDAVSYTHLDVYKRQRQ